METFKKQDYTIHICKDIIEWAKEFYDMPDDSELEDADELSKQCMGFAQIDEKTIWIFVPEKCLLHDLRATVAHEIGHIIEMEYPTNFEQSEENDDLHEMKADHYMNFYLLVSEIIDHILISSY